MDGLVSLLVVAAAAFAVGLSAPANHELAEIERILAETKHHRRTADQNSNVAAEGFQLTFEHPFKKSSKEKNDPWTSFDFTSPSWDEKMAEQEQLRRPLPYHGSYPQLRLQNNKDIAEKEQSLPFDSYGEYPQRRKNEDVGGRAAKEQWEVYGWPMPREKLAEEEKKGAKEQLVAIQHHHNASLRHNSSHSSNPRTMNRSANMIEFLDGQTSRMKNFIESQTKRMLDFSNQTTTFVRRERNLTAEFMKRERNSTLEFLRDMHQREEMPRIEKKGGNVKKEEAEVQLHQPNMHIPTPWRDAVLWRQDAMNTARIQGFLRKIAPYILRKING